LYAQPANDNSDAATLFVHSINNCSANTAYTTIRATADGNVGSCWKNGPNYTVWFSFIATTTEGTVITSTAVTTFSPFTLASISLENPLPIELNSFKVNLNKGVALIDWVTSSEINNDYFTIEKSKDGIIWIFVNEQSGAGNSNSVLYYSDVDNSPFAGVSYYRLKQTDFNGESKYSEIVSLENIEDRVISIYPNPVKDVLIIANMEVTFIVKVYSINGQIIYSGNTSKINTSEWSNGIYQLIVSNSQGELIKKEKVVK
jgi:hypothetical protein